MDRTTPPSTRRAAPLVADAAPLQTYATMAATSSVVANLLSSELGLIVLKKSDSTAPALFQCGDGRYVYFVLFVADLKPWQALVDWMDTKGLAADLLEPQYADARFRQENFGHIQEIVEVFFLLQTAHEAYHDGQARGLPIGIAYAPDDLFHDEHLVARDFFVTVEHEDGPPARYPGPPFRFSAFGAVAMARAPRLGEHTESLLQHAAVTAGEGGS